MADDKTKLRLEMKRRRQALSPAERARRSDLACARLLAWPDLARWLPAGSRVATYIPLPTELDPLPAVRALAKRAVRIAAPRAPRRITSPAPLDWIDIDPDLPLAPGRFGVPTPGDDCPPLALGEAIDAFLLPALAFDEGGRRLGYGKGFFDATLAAIPRALRILLAFELQHAEPCPSEAHDQRVDLIVTEQRLELTGARPITLPRGRGAP